MKIFLFLRLVASIKATFRLRSHQTLLICASNLIVKSHLEAQVLMLGVNMESIDRQPTNSELGVIVAKLS